MIASVLIMLTLGGSIATTTIPPSFVALQDPGQVKAAHDLGALAVYYNTTLAQIGTKRFANASFLLDTFSFVNIPPSVNATAQSANADLAVVNSTSANATVIFRQADAAIRAKEYVNATLLVNQACALADQANRSLADFQGPQTARFRAESVPVAQYSRGLGVASAEVQSLVGACASYRSQLGFSGLVLLIGSPQAAIETGGTVSLVGNLTFRGSPVANDEVLFYINGTYFGSLTTTPGGGLAGTLRIPFIYSRFASVQALAPPNATLSLGGATSNTLTFQILFNETAISLGDPKVLPTSRFSVHGNLTTASGSGLPDAPVKITFFNQSVTIHTDTNGEFATRLTVPAYASDGVYDVYASFAPQGVFGPSFNFTSVQVYHLPMDLAVDAPSLSLAGFSATVTGRASSNGSAVAGANVTLDSPWGSVTATTNSTGGFKVSVPVSPLEFAFSGEIVVKASAPQPYIAPATVAESLGVFNILLVVLPAAAVGIIGYEADRLGMFDRLRRRGAGQEEAGVEGYLPSGEGGLGATEAVRGEELRAYRRALELAAERFSMRFRRSQTIREMASLVGARDTGEGFRVFSQLMLTAEDYLYSERFDRGRLKTADEQLARLEELWR